MRKKNTHKNSIQWGGGGEYTQKQYTMKKKEYTETVYNGKKKYTETVYNEKKNTQKQYTMKKNHARTESIQRERSKNYTWKMYTPKKESYTKKMYRMKKESYTQKKYPMKKRLIHTEKLYDKKEVHIIKTAILKIHAHKNTHNCFGLIDT